MPDPRYSTEPEDREAFTRGLDRSYTAFASVYAAAVRWLPVWQRWIGAALPHIRGPRVLEVSFGTGYLLSRYAGRFEVHGADFNRRMVQVTRRALDRAGRRAKLIQADVEHLPYRDACFDSLVSTMAFSGYPSAHSALAELTRVLRPGGRLILVDVNFPADGNALGTRCTELWKRGGDLIRDMGQIFEQAGLDYSDEEIGGWGSIHLYLATPKTQRTDATP